MKLNFEINPSDHKLDNKSWLKLRTNQINNYYKILVQSFKELWQNRKIKSFKLLKINIKKKRICLRIASMTTQMCKIFR